MESSTGKAVFLFGLAFLIKSCGTIENHYYRTQPTNLSFEDVKPLIDQHCGSCHNGTTHPLKFDSESDWKESTAKPRIEAGTMPPGGDIPGDVKDKLLGSF